MSDNQEYISLKIAFEPFALFEQGQPIRILPQGTWHRGDRKLEITKERLMEMAGNFAGGLPRFRIPINLDHEKNGGKVGTIKKIQYLPNGPKGPGLYATEYEFTAKGLEAIEENGYDAVSAEVVWTVGGKMGGTYQDPETGKDFDNVLVGMALTPTPFFGHGNVALFSAEEHSMAVPEAPYGGAKSFEEYKLQKGEQEERNRISNLHYIFHELFDNIWGDPFMAIPDKIKAVNQLTRDFGDKVVGGDEYSEDNPAQEETMSEDTQVVDEKVADVETEDTGVQLSPEEFATLKAKADLADTHADTIETLEEEKEAQKAEQQEAELRLLAKSYSALPVEIDEFVAKMTAIESADAETASWVKAQFASFDVALEEAGTLEELGTDEEGDGEDPGLKFLQIVDKTLKEDYEGDPARYAEALLKASADHPELAQYA
ncbi:MAG: hypothetical protein ACXABY_02380 [Candidatus Thorarchaeota archaeon]|jgi:hypothetical protein